MIQRNLSENGLIQSKNEVHLHEVTLNQSKTKISIDIGIVK
jgi:hypothetical protein